MSEKLLNPIIYLAFADSRKDLDGLKGERRKIYDAIRDASKKQSQYFESDGDSEMDFDYLVKELQEEVSIDQLAVFHYGGHAGEGKLILASDDGKEDPTDVQTFAGLFNKFKNLHLVFLNGCSSETLVNALLDVGIPLVIASNRSIPDAPAARFAELFYREISQGVSIRSAFETARKILEKDFGYGNPDEQDRAMGRRRETEESSEDGFFWGLYQRGGQQNAILKWQRDEDFDESSLDWDLSQVYEAINAGRQTSSPQVTAGTTIETETIIGSDGTKTERTRVVAKDIPIWQKMWADKRVKIGVPSGIALVALMVFLMQRGFINDAPKFKSKENYNVYLLAKDEGAINGSFGDRLAASLKTQIADNSFLAKEGQTKLIEILPLEEEIPAIAEKKANLVVEVDISDAGAGRDYAPGFLLADVGSANLNTFGPQKEDRRVDREWYPKYITEKSDNEATYKDSKLVKRLHEFILWSYGYEFFGKQEYQKAIEVWENIESAKTHPEEYTPYYLAMAVSHYNKTQPDKEKALTYLNTFLENDTTTGAFYYRGKIHYDQKKFENALSDYNWILNPQGTNSSRDIDDQFKVNVQNKSKEIRRSRGDVNFNLRKFVPAIEDFTQFLEEDTSNASIWIKRGHSYHMIDSFKRADDDFDYVLSKNPDDLEALFGKAKLYTDRYLYYKTTSMPSQIMKDGISQKEKYRFNRALELLKKGEELDPADPRFPLYLGNLYRTIPDQISFAKKKLKQATELNKSNKKVDDIEINYVWGMYHMNLPNPSVDSMKKYFQKVLDEDSTYSPALYEMGNIHHVYTKSRDVNKSIEYYHKCIRYDSTHAWAHLNLGSMLKFRSAATFTKNRKEDRTAAIQAFETGHALIYPHYSRTHYIQQLQLYAFFARSKFRKACKTIQEREITAKELEIKMKDLKQMEIDECVERN